MKKILPFLFLFTSMTANAVSIDQIYKYIKTVNNGEYEKYDGITFSKPSLNAVRNDGKFLFQTPQLWSHTLKEYNQSRIFSKTGKYDPVFNLPTCFSDNDCESGETCQMNREDIDGDGLGDVCDPCFHSPDQTDSYPPGGNGIGDACECEGDFDCDGDVDGSDAVKIKADFGRGPYLRPCTNEDPCKGDFDCDGDVDGTDAAIFKKDFGRSNFINPCPICVEGIEWCQYE